MKDYWHSTEDDDNDDITGFSVAIVAESAPSRSAMVPIKDILQIQCATVASDGH